jgi:hypothetical protein
MVESLGSANANKGKRRPTVGLRLRENFGSKARGAVLLLPGALFVTVGAELLAAFVLINFRFAAFLQ